jgi:hypothetical protein
MLTNPTAPTSRSIGTRYLNMANGVQIGFRLHNTAADGKEYELNWSCPHCLFKAANKRYCENPECEAAGEIQGDATKAYSDGSEGIRVEIRPEDMEELMMPPPKNAKGQYQGKATLYPDKNHFHIHSRLTEREAIPYLLATTKKYFLAPEKGPSVTLYSTLQEALQRQKMCLMVKFCVNTPRQQLGIIHVEDDVLVMAVIPFAKQLRVIPTVNRVKVDKPFVDAFVEILNNVEQKPYEEASDDFEIAFNYLVELKTLAVMEKQMDVKTTKKKVKKEPTPLDISMENLIKESKALREKRTAIKA